MVPSSIFSSLPDFDPCFCHCITFWLWSCCLLLDKDAWDATGLMWAIQIIAYTKIFNLITSAKSLSPLRSQIYKFQGWSSHRGSVETNLTSIHEDAGSILGLAQCWLRVCRCRELWCRSQMRLRSGVAVAVASSYSSESTPSLGTSICCWCSPKETKDK